jgi:hypothetical protein
LRINRGFNIAAEVCFIWSGGANRIWTRGSPYTLGMSMFMPLWESPLLSRPGSLDSLLYPFYTTVVNFEPDEDVENGSSSLVTVCFSWICWTSTRYPRMTLNLSALLVSILVVATIRWLGGVLRGPCNCHFMLLCCCYTRLHYLYTLGFIPDPRLSCHFPSGSLLGGDWYM